MNISRRDFLKGIAAGAVSAGALGTLSTITAPLAYADNAETVASPLAALDKIPQAYLNPQLDEAEYRGNAKELKLLFSPLQIGKLNLNHRMVKTAAGSACYLAGMTDELI